MNKLLIAAGHAGSTAYAVIEEFKQLKPNWEIVFVGSKTAMEGKHYKTIENAYLPKAGVKFVPIVSGRLQRRFSLWTIPSLLKIPVGFLHALLILFDEKPNVILSFGGFSAFPIVVVGWVLAIPVIIHDQTTSAGRSNLASSRFATKIALSRSDSLKYFPNLKSVVVGNPISQEVVNCTNKKHSVKKGAIFITGGSRGSVSLNKIVKEILPKLLEDFIVYHQTGDVSFSEFEKFKNSLEPKIKSKYHPFSKVEMWNWYKYLRDSDILVSRSGANIVSEAIEVGIPSIFIPLPFAYNDEQKKNALYAKSLGLAKVLNENELSKKSLLDDIYKTNINWNKIVKSYKRPLIDDGKAARKLCNIILEYAKV